VITVFEDVITTRIFLPFHAALRHNAGETCVTRPKNPLFVIGTGSKLPRPAGDPPAKEIDMADVKRGNRPLSPHLQIYRPQLTSMTSILTRITGNGLLIPGAMIVWWLLAAATGPEYFAVADFVLRSWIGKLIMLGAIWAVWYHFLAGLRHLWFDSGRGLEIRTAERLGIAVIAGSLVLTLITVIVL